MIEGPFFTLWPYRPNPALNFIERPRITLREIAAQVCAKHQISMEEFQSQRCSQFLVAARCEFGWRARRETKASYPRIANFVRPQDHTAAMNWERRWPHYAKKFGFDVENPILSPTAPARAVA